MKTKIVLLILGIMFINACTTPPETAQRAQVGSQESVMEKDTGSLTKVMYDKDQSFFEFEGYGPGKSHLGTFEQGEMYFYYNDDNELVKFEGTINPASVKSDSGGLDNHLKNEDFFNINVFPKISAVSTSIDKENGEITGDLTFLGITKELAFPASITDKSVETDFVFDTAQFGMSYAGVNPEVRVAFKFVVAE